MNHNLKLESAEAAIQRLTKRVNELRAECADLRVLLKSASYHVESEGDVTLLTRIREVLE